jgi:hypothetical protein
MVRNIKQRKKTLINKLTITKADKGKAVVIITQEEYKHEINNFIEGNHFIAINNNLPNNIKKH